MFCVKHKNTHEAETAIKLLPSEMQDNLQHHVAHKLERLYKEQRFQQQHINITAKNEEKTTNQIKKKLPDHKSM